MPYLWGFAGRNLYGATFQFFLLKGRLLDWYVVFTNPYMASSSLLGLGLENLAMLFNNLV